MMMLSREDTISLLGRAIDITANNFDCQGCNALMRNALALLKEQEDLGAELTNAVELIHKKNERIEKLLKEQKEVVRCKDCEYYTEPDSHGDRCDKIHWSRGDDWFCADGKRKELQ